MNATRTLSVVGLWGALLTVVILAMSVLLRLGTQVEAGEAVSTLAPAVEQWARIAHRVAAMGVGILAALALVTAWRDRPMGQSRLAGVACVVGLTLLLALIGRYTPGYRIDLVTIVNVAGGIALAAAFWWLRAPAAGGRADPVALVALALALVLAAVGAAADAAMMRGERSFGPLHLWLAAIFAAFALAATWRGRARRAPAIGVVVLLAAQLGLGLVLVGSGRQPLALAWSHALIGCVLALLLVSLAVTEKEPQMNTDEHR